MLALLTHTVFLIGEALRAPFDALMGRARRVYTVSLDVEAPRAVTWAVASAHTVRLEGVPPIDIVTREDADRPNVYIGHLKIGDIKLPMAYRVLDERPGEAMSIAVLKAESAPECCPGEDYICAFAVTGDDTVSTLTSTYQLTHTSFASRLLVPFSAIQNIRRLKRNAEMRAGKPPAGAQEAVKAALLTGALTFASFFAMFGPSAAVMLLALILVHEVGHVVAMRSIGMPVKGIYFVPFFGGVAVSGDRYRNEGERGFVALMGPGFSLLTTAVLGWLTVQNNDPTLKELTLLSAALNGFNLLPLLPLDGGHVMQSLLSRVSDSTVRVVNVLALIAGVWLALAIKSPVLLIVLLLVGPSLLSSKARALRLEPLTSGQIALLSTAYAATLVFYIAIFATMSNLPGEGPAPSSPMTDSRDDAAT